MIALLTGMAALSANAAEGLAITSPESGDTFAEGAFLLKWEAGDSTDLAAFVVEHARDAEFTDLIVRFEGRDRAHFVSGMARGDHWFRVAALNESGERVAVSEPVQVATSYIAMSTVWTLIAIGSVVLAITVASVVTGHARNKREAVA